jgi:hypothetical protein
MICLPCHLLYSCNIHYINYINNINS